MPKQPSRDGVFQCKERGRAWYVSYVDAGGTRRKRKVEAYTETQALAALRIIKTREERDKLLGIRTQTEDSLADLLKRFKAYQKSRVGPATLIRLNGVVSVLVANLPEKARALTRKDVADYIAMRSETVAPGTIFKEVTVLKHALRIAVEDWQMLHTNVAQGAKLPKSTQGRTRYLSPSELKAVLEAAPDWLRAPIALAVATGMRRGEVLGLRWTDVDVLGRRLYLRETKNGTLRVLALNDLALRVLDSIPSDGIGPVFPGLDPMRLTDNTRHLFKRLGIEDASYHSLRHTAASWMVMGGVDLYAVGQMLGHKTPLMTQRYAHLSPEYMQLAANKLDVALGDILPSNSGTPRGLRALTTGPNPA